MTPTLNCFLRNCRNTSTPFMPGMYTSRTISRGTSCSTNVSACWPSVARRTLYPQGQEALEQIADRFLIVHHQNEIPIARGGRGRLRGFRGRRGFSGRGRIGRLWERPLYRLHQDLQREPLAQKIL